MQGEVATILLGGEVALMGVARGHLGGEEGREAAARVVAEQRQPEREEGTPLLLPSR